VSGWRGEATALLADAGEWLREWIEEGVEDFDRSLAGPVPAPEVPIGPEALLSPPVEAPGRAAPPPPKAVSPPSEARAPAAEPTAEATVPWTGRPSLDEVRAFLGDCRRCDLCERRSRIVFGDGDPDASILFVGEGPGQQEDEQGLPFVGRAGELLTQMIEKGMGMARSDVYICNIVKCRPPNNRNPLPPEVAACRPFLDGQIDAVAPKVIVTLGKPAASLLLGREVAITRVRGTWQSYRGIPLMPTLHPAYVLRQYTQEVRRMVWEDLKAALARSRQE